MGEPVQSLSHLLSSTKGEPGDTEGLGHFKYLVVILGEKTADGRFPGGLLCGGEEPPLPRTFQTHNQFPVHSSNITGGCQALPHRQSPSWVSTSYHSQNCPLGELLEARLHFETPEPISAHTQCTRVFRPQPRPCLQHTPFNLPSLCIYRAISLTFFHLNFSTDQ